jgi:N-glycosylase/DNA lyase
VSSEERRGERNRLESMEGRRGDMRRGEKRGDTVVIIFKTYIPGNRASKALMEMFSVKITIPEDIRNKCASVKSKMKTVGLPWKHINHLFGNHVPKGDHYTHVIG